MSVQGVWFGIGPRLGILRDFLIAFIPVTVQSATSLSTLGPGLTGNHTENATQDQHCREVFAREQKALQVTGPVAVAEVEEETAALHRGLRRRSASSDARRASGSDREPQRCTAASMISWASSGSSTPSWRAEAAAAATRSR